MLRTRVTERLGLGLPILQAPMAGVATPALAAAVSNAGGLGGLGLGASTPEQAAADMATLRGATNRPFGVNVFVHAHPDPDPPREAVWLARLQPLFQALGAAPPAALTPAYPTLADMPAMVEAIVAARPAVVSSHFGLLPEAAAEAVRGYGGVLLASATTVAEALAVEAAGYDAVIAQGQEAGGHRGTFGEADEGIGTLALVPRVVDAVSIPVIAAGGIADGRGIAAALALGAEAVQVGTAYIACPESAASAAYRALLDSDRSSRTTITRVLSGRRARAIRTHMIDALEPVEAEAPPYPVAYDAAKALAAAERPLGTAEHAAVWAGQHVVRGRALPAADLTLALMAEAQAVMARLGSAAGTAG